MAEIGAQCTHVSQNRLRIVPACFQRTHCKGVAQVMQSGTRPALAAIAKLPDDPDEDHMGSGRGRGSTVTQYEEIVACAANLASGCKILFKRGPCRSMQRHQAAFAELAATNHKAVIRQIIAAEGKSLRNAETCRGKQSE